MAGFGETSTPRPGAGSDTSAETEEAAAFARAYGEAAQRYALAPSEEGLEQAYELGRQALGAGTSLLHLVEAHGEVQRRLDGGRSARHEAVDRFFVEALAAFELAQRGYAEARQAAHGERARAELARGLTQAYLVVAAADTAAGRCRAAEAQVRALLGATDARIEFGSGGATASATGRPASGDDGAALWANLPDGTGRLVAVGEPGRSWTEADRANLEQLAILVHGPITDARLLEFAERLERLGAMLGAEADPDTIIDRVLADGLEHTAASFGAILLPAGRRLRVAGARSAGRFAVGDLLDLDAPSPIAMAAATATPVFLADEAERARWAERHGARVDTPGRAWAAVPLRASTGPCGVFAMRFEEPQPFDAAQRSFLTRTGERIAAALERGRLYAHERSARRAAEGTTRRVAQLGQLANDLSHATTRRDVATILARYAVHTTGARLGIVAGTGRQPDEAELLAAAGPDGGRLRLPEAVLFELARVAALASPATAAVAGSTIPRRVASRLAEAGIAVVGVHPLSSGSRRVGGVLLGWGGTDPPRFDPEVLDSALAVAGPALRRAGRYDTDHDIAVTLQRSLLTDPDPAIPGVEWSAQYRSGSPGVAGGDWYDVIRLPDGSVALAIGDIVGKGVEAAAAMGQLRSATRALAQRIKDPAELLGVLDDYARTTRQGLYSSMVFAVLERSGPGRVLHHAVAGHPPPLVRTAQAEVVAVSTGRGPLLGVEAHRTTATLALGDDDVLVLYTDGLIERRHRPLHEGVSQLRRVVREGPANPMHLCRHIVSAMDDGTATDDIAVVAARPTPVRALHSVAAPGPS